MQKEVEILKTTVFGVELKQLKPKYKNYNPKKRMHKKGGLDPL
jgi:hypothetical protein